MFIRRLILRLLPTLALSAGLVLAQERSADYEKAVQAHEEKKYTEAYIHLKNVLQDNPDDVSARLLLAQVYLSAGDIYGAEKEAGEALLLGADVNLVLPVYGPALVLQKNIRKLFELEKVADSFTPENQFEWALLKGQGYLIEGDQSAALREFERAARMFPDDVRSSNTLAAVYLRANLAEKAREQIERSMALDADNSKTWELRGELAVMEQGYEEALPHFLKAYALNSRDIKILRALARTYLQLGDREQTRRYLGEMLAVSPEDPAATLISAIMMIGEGDRASGDSMLSDLSNKLSEMDFVKNQTNDTMVFIQASADYVRGSDKSAIALLNSYLPRNREDIAAIRMLVDLHLRNGDNRAALELLDTHQPQIAGDVPLQMNLAHLYTSSGKLYSARKVLERLKTAIPSDNPYMLLLEAELLQAKGMPLEALRLLTIYDFEDDVPLNYTLLQGALELEVGQLESARERAVLLNERYPGNTRVLQFCSLTYLALEDLTRAKRCIDDGLADAPENVELRFAWAMLLKKRGEYDASGKVLNAILEETPSHTRSILLMARMLMLQGRYDEAIDWSNKVYAYDRNAVRPAELQLDIYEETEDWQSARNTGMQLVRAYPGNTDYLERLALAHTQLGEREEARNRYRRLRELWQQSPRRLRYLAGLQVNAGLPDEARESLETALERAPQSFTTRLALARLDINEGKYKEARAIARTLREEFGDRAEIAFIEGEVALAQGDTGAAQADYMRAFRMQPANLDVTRRLYELSLEGVGAREFTSALEQALQNGALPVISARLLADSYLAQGNTAAARDYYEQLLALEPFANDPGILNNLANIYAQDDLDKALVTVMRALDNNDDHGSALLDTAGWILVRRGAYEEALFYLRQAYAKNSTDPGIRYHTAVALNALGRQVEARRELRAALAMTEEFSARVDAQRLLDSLPQEKQ